MAGRQNMLDNGQGGWFGDPRGQSEAAKKGRERETHAPVKQPPKQRPKEIGGVPVPVAVPPDAEMVFVGSKEELIEEAKEVPASKEKMATTIDGVYVLWTREKR